MISELLSMYNKNYPKNIIYMLQSTEYEVVPFVQWLWRTKNFNQVNTRRDLVKTKAAKLLLLLMFTGMLIQIVVGILALLNYIDSGSVRTLVIGILLLLSYPVVWAHLITLPLIAAKHLIVKPKQKKLVEKSADIFAGHQAVKIAVAGSYGKTTVKELLFTILSEGKKVAATPANKNVAVSHAQYASNLTGDEDILVIELGEGQPGDVTKFSQTIKPDIGVITGIAPAHLDKYKTLDAAANDIFSLSDFVNPGKLYVNKKSNNIEKYLKPEFITYDSQSVAGWKITDIDVSIDNLKFSMKKGKRKIDLTSGLIGRHLVGPIAVCVAIAHELGLTDKQIVDGVAKTKPFEHRMQPRMLAGGWVIDDSYNGNLEGIRAGLALLSELPAKRKIYVTPGLVDQGAEAEPVHVQLGKYIAAANPDKVILMKNSVTKWIQTGLSDGNYNGKVVVEDDPLNFYTNLDQVIAVGDIIMMQNDWTDNYN